MSFPDSVERLGRLLIEKGILSPEQLDHCLREHRTSIRQGKPRELSEIIVSRGYLDAEKMTQVLETGKGPLPLRPAEKKQTRCAPAPPKPRGRLWIAATLAGGGLLAAIAVVALLFRGEESRPEPAPAPEPPPPAARTAPEAAPVPAPARKPRPPLIGGDAEERKLQEAFLDAVVGSIRNSPHDLARLALRDRVLEGVRLLDATRDTLFVRHRGRAIELPWDEVAPSEVAELGREPGAGARGRVRGRKSVRQLRRSGPSLGPRRDRALAARRAPGPIGPPGPARAVLVPPRLRAGRGVPVRVPGAQGIGARPGPPARDGPPGRPRGPRGAGRPDPGRAPPRGRSRKLGGSRGDRIGLVPRARPRPAAAPRPGGPPLRPGGRRSIAGAARGDGSTRPPSTR